MNQPLANIHPKAKIGKDVVIEPFATIQEDTVIGDNSNIGANAVIMNGARLGTNVKVFPGAVISAIPQDLKFNGEVSTVEIGNNTVVREFVTINRGTVAKGKTIVGNNCLLMAYSHVAHDCIIGNNVIFANGVQAAGEVEVGDYAILGGSTLVHQFCKIGAHVMTQGGLKVLKDIPPFVMAAREPAAFAGVNSVGLKRRGFTSEQIEEIKDIYRVIFNKGLNYTNAVKKVKAEFPDSDIKNTIIDFFEKSDRGVIPTYSSEIKK
jgi:UDP-N-acetylglucosamine acyltransferase